MEDAVCHELVHSYDVIHRCLVFFVKDLLSDDVLELTFGTDS
jgi:hypothetical protein